VTNVKINLLGYYSLSGPIAQFSDAKGRVGGAVRIGRAHRCRDRNGVTFSVEANSSCVHDTLRCGGKLVYGASSLAKSMDAGELAMETAWRKRTHSVVQHRSVCPGIEAMTMFTEHEIMNILPIGAE
jgi:hypothetical protein